MFCTHGGGEAGQSSVFTMSRWSLCVSLWEAANKKAHLTHESIVGMHLFSVFFHGKNMGTFTNGGFKKILF